MKKAIQFILPVMGMYVGVATAETNEPCVKATTTQVEGLFDRWNESLKTGDPKKVAGNYTADAILLPTLSNKPRTNDEERKDYFEYFLKNEPVGKIDSRKIFISCNKAVDTGTYTFTFKNGDPVQARYTFSYLWNGKEWKISSHHSSAMPEST